MRNRPTMGQLFHLLREVHLGGGWSLQDVATATGISKACIYQIENDKSKDVAFRIIIKLSDFYGVKLDRIADCLRNSQ